MTTREFVKRFLIVILTIVLLLAAWELRTIVILVFLAALIAVGMSVPAGWLQRHGWRRGPAYTLIVLLSGLVVTLVLFLFIIPMITEITQLVDRIPVLVTALESFYRNVRFSNEALLDLLPPLDSTILQRLDATAAVNELRGISSWLARGFGTAFGVLGNLVFVAVVAVFFTIDPPAYMRGLLLLLPADYHPRAHTIVREINRTLRSWFSAQLLSVSVTVALVWIVLGVLLSMPNALLVAVVAGFATFIPNIGSLLPLIPIVVFGIAEAPSRLLVYVPLYLLIQLIESNVITPSIVKNELRIPAGLVLIFQVIAASLFGAWGILIAVPLLAVLTTLVREIYSYDILGNRPVTLSELGPAPGEPDEKPASAKRQPATGD